MPNWKKVIVSGSNAALNSLFVSTSVTASIFSGSAFTGSLFGTASWAINALTSSFATNAGSASYALNAGNAQSASFTSTASSADNFLVRGTLTAQTIVAQVITSSTDFVTGSTRFGTLLSNTHQFTGSVSMTGSLDVNGTGRFTDTLIISSSSSNGALVIQQNSVGFAAQFVNRPDITNAIGQIAFSDLKTGAGNRAFGIGIGRSGDPQWINGDFIFAYYSGSGTWQQSAKIFNTSGNWIIGTSSLDEGFKLDVNGTARVNGTTTITGSLTVITGSNIEFQVSNTGVRIGNVITDVHTVTGSLGVSGSTLITNALTVGSSSLGAAENTLVLGPAPAGGAGEGGQILLAASGGLYTSASMWDNWQNQTRLLRGTNAGSDAVIASFNMHSKQVQFPAYTGSGAFTGTATANLAVDSNGNIITVATGSGGGSAFPFTGSAQISGSLVINGPITASGAITSTANGAMYFRGGDDAEFWDINVTNTVGIYGQQDQGVASIKLGNNGGTISGRSGSIGIGTINPTSASLTVNGNIWALSLTGSLLGTASFATSASFASNAGSASYALNAGNAISASFTTNANSASYALNAGNAITASFATNANSASYALNAGNAQSASFANNAGSASYALNAGNAQSSSFAATASSADNFTVRGTLTAQTIVVQTITSSVDFVTGSTRFGTIASNTHQFTGSVSISGSLTVQGAISGSNITGSLLGTASYANNALSSSYAVNAGNSITASFATNANSSSYALNAGNAQSASFATNAANAFIQNGNSFGTQALLGTNDAQNLAFETNGIVRMTVSSSGNVGIGTTTPSASLHISGSTSGAEFSLLVQNTSAQTLISVQNDRTVNINATNATNGNTNIGTTNGTINFNTGYNNTFVGNALTFYIGGARSTIQGFNDSPGLAIGYAQTNVNPNPGTGLSIRGITALSGSAVLFVTGSSTTRLLALASETSSSILVVSGSGNIGIGTASPAAILHSIGSGIVNIVQSSNTVSYTQYYNTSTGTNSTNDGLTIGNNGTAAYIYQREADALVFGTSNEERMRITSVGSIGIGTNAPTAILHISNSISASILRVDTAGGVGLFVSGSGNVGIGTTSPSEKLDINGNAIISGSLTVITGSNIELQVLNTGVRIGNIISDIHTVTGSLGISGSVTATNFTGSLFGTASWANNVVSSSYALNAGNAQTASFAITASFALNGGGGPSGPSSGAAYTHTQASPSTTWTVDHSLNNSYPVVTVYDFNGFVVVPLNISSSNVNRTTITFSYGATGYATAVAAGVSNIISASFATNAATAQTASFFGGSISSAVSASYASSSTSASFATNAVTAQTASFFSGTVTSASYALNAGNTQTASFATNAGSASYALNSGNTITASFATNTNSASYALNAGNTQTASFAINAGSASYALNAGNTQSSSFAATASSADNFLVRGTLTAQTIVVQTITSSVNFVTGSTRFGTIASNTHVFTGSVSISGSLTVQGAISGSNITGSLLGTASFATNTLSSSYALNAGNTISSSFSTNAGSSSYALNAGNAITASFALNGGGGGGTPGGSNTQIQYNNASTFGGVPVLTYDGTTLRVTGSFTGSLTGALTGTASFAQTASFFGGSISTAVSASYASASTSASFATNAQTASFALNGNSNFLHTQSIAATTWSVNHNFQTQFPVVTVYDSTNSVIIPQQISASSTSSLTILFATARTGWVAVSKGGYAATVGNTVTVTSASYAATASYAEGFNISLSQYSATSSAISGSSRIIAIPTASYNAVFVDYVVSSGSNQRAGTFIGTWNSNNVQFTDASTLDIGSTIPVTMSVAISGSRAVVQTQSPAGWTIKTTYRTI
jgi:hypothetical protein